MGMAIGWFATHGYTVCVPLTDSQNYDLVIDSPDGLKKVFVRTTTRMTRHGTYECGLRTSGGNRSQTKIKHFDPSSVDFVFIISGDESKYLIPSSEMVAKTSINLGKDKEKYRV